MDERPTPERVLGTEHFERFRVGVLRYWPDCDEEEIALQYRDWIMGVDGQ